MVAEGARRRVAPARMFRRMLEDAEQHAVVVSGRARAKSDCRRRPRRCESFQSGGATDSSGAVAGTGARCEQANVVFTGCGRSKRLGPSFRR